MGQDLVCWPCRTFVGHVQHKTTIFDVPKKALKLRVWLKSLLSGNLDILTIVHLLREKRYIVPMSYMSDICPTLRLAGNR
jgi:hypothetical protein